MIRITITRIPNRDTEDVGKLFNHLVHKYKMKDS